MSLQSVLIVEDDLKVRTLLRNILEDDGFSVFEASSAAEGLRLFKARAPDLITLDLHLGSENGIELAREIRRESNVPIIMVSGKGDVIDRVVGLEVGADDYITKPFHVREVIARVRSVLRRVGAQPQPMPDPTSEKGTATGPASAKRFGFDGLTIVPDHLQLLDRSGQDCGLTSGDFKLLKVFVDRPKHVLSRDQLMDLTGGQEWTPLDRTIDNQIARLRKKIERDPSHPQLIKTVRGIGYSFACDIEPLQSSESPAKRA